MTDTKLDEIFNNKKNGSNLENRVAKLLKEYGWTVSENQPYLDPNTEKQREIDIVAVKEHTIISNHPPEILEMRLFIDCKNLSQPLGLYARSADKKSLTVSLLNNRVYDQLFSDFYEIGNDISEMLKTHRYFLNTETIYKSTNNDDKSIGIQGINQVLHAMLSDIYRSYRIYNVDYPVIIVDDISKIAIESMNETRRVANNNMIYSIDYIVNKKKQTFIADIVALNTLEIFLIQLQCEFDNLKDPAFKRVVNDRLVQR